MSLLCAFDLLELEGHDFSPAPLEERKYVLGNLLRSVRGSHASITLNEHYEGDGAPIYRHVCALGCEGMCPSGVATRTAVAGSITGSRSRTCRRAGEARGGRRLERQAMGARAASLK
jgi:hypothetical protein